MGIVESENPVLYTIRCFRDLILEKYPLSEEDSAQWDKIPRVDGQVAKVSKMSSPF